MAATTIASGVRRSIDLLTRAPRHPVPQLLLWYGLLGLVGSLLARNVPIFRLAIGSEPLLGDVPLANDLFDSGIAVSSNTFTGDLLMIIVMIGTLLLSIPVSWGYMAVREREGYDQSVVQTIVVLPIVVAAIMMIVQHSLALAFALAGVSAAVRFRNTLKDVADATYVFLALGIGIAAGVGALAGAWVMSFIFVSVSVTLWRCNFGFCPTTVAFGTAENSGSVLSGNRSIENPPRRRGVLSVRVSDAAGERTAIEAVLGYLSKKWNLNQVVPEGDGGALLRYHVRLRKSARPDTVVHEVISRGGDGVLAAAFDPPPRDS